VNTARLLRTEKAKLFAGDDELIAVGAKLLTAARSSSDSVALGLAAEVVADTLLVRVASWRFLTTQEVGGPSSFEVNLAKTQEAIVDFEKASVAPDIRGLIVPVKEALDRYAASFKSVAADLIRMNDLHDSELLPRLAKMQTAIDSAETLLRKKFGDARTSAESTIETATHVQEIASVLALILGGVFTFWLGRSLVRPITRLTRAVERLARGDTETTIPCRDEPNEIGAMANAAEVFKQSAIARTRLETQAIETRSASTRKAEMTRLANEFEKEVGVFAGTVSSASSELENAATNLSMRAKTTQRLSTNVVTVSEQASALVRMVASAAEELDRSVTEIAHQVQISSKIAGNAVQQARETNTRIATQSKAAARISEVIKLITAVAEQTNLLALNATIEAARAGSPARDSRSSPKRSRRSLSRPQRPRPRLEHRFPRCRQRPTIRWPQLEASEQPSTQFRKLRRL
jgi:methyl-accepting chemotaxis protein